VAGLTALVAGLLVYVLASPLGILERALLEHRLGLPEGYLDEAVDRAAEIPLEEINRFIARYYDAGAFSMVRVVPEAGHE
jgi:predicted Zn-dependent peptidase